MIGQTTTDIEIKVDHVFCRLGGGAKGFNRGQARVGNLRAKSRCLDGIDVDPGSIRDFEKLVGMPAVSHARKTIEAADRAVERAAGGVR